MCALSFLLRTKLLYGALRMAKQTGTERAAERAAEKAARAAKPVPSGPLAEARAALERGDLRSAKTLLASLNQDVGDLAPAAAAQRLAERTEARELSATVSPDPQALLASLNVFVVIAVAAIAALFLRHG